MPAWATVEMSRIIDGSIRVDSCWGYLIRFGQAFSSLVPEKQAPHKPLMLGGTGLRGAGVTVGIS